MAKGTLYIIPLKVLFVIQFLDFLEIGVENGFPTKRTKVFLNDGFNWKKKEVHQSSDML